jgi:hypothetical protein
MGVDAQIQLDHCYSEELERGDGVVVVVDAMN